MNLINKTAFLSSVLMLVMATGAQAGNQGIDFFYGVGIVAMSTDEDIGGLEYDMAGGGEFMLGVEEDGWAFEYSAIRMLEAGTNNTALNYTAAATQLSLAYRTIEKNNIYYKIKAGSMTLDIDFSGTTPFFATDGDFVGLAMGMRTGQEARVELEYTLYSSDDIDTTHMLTLRYLFGGSSYQGTGVF
jgi:hypothetical protein